MNQTRQISDGLFQPVIFGQWAPWLDICYCVCISLTMYYPNYYLPNFSCEKRICTAKAAGCVLRCLFHLIAVRTCSDELINYPFNPCTQLHHILMWHLIFDALNRVITIPNKPINVLITISMTVHGIHRKRILMIVISKPFERWLKLHWLPSFEEPGFSMSHNIHWVLKNKRANVVEYNHLLALYSLNFRWLFQIQCFN